MMKNFAISANKDMKGTSSIHQAGLRRDSIRYQGKLKGIPVYLDPYATDSLIISERPDGVKCYIVSKAEYYKSFLESKEYKIQQ